MTKDLELLPSGDPELIQAIEKAISDGMERIRMRVNIEDENGGYIDNFVTDLAPVVGDFIDLNDHGKRTSYQVIERRFSLDHIWNETTKAPVRVRTLEIKARVVTS